MRSTLPSSRRRAWAWPYGAAVSCVDVRSAVSRTTRRTPAAEYDVATAHAVTPPARTNRPFLPRPRRHLEERPVGASHGRPLGALGLAVRRHTGVRAARCADGRQRDARDTSARHPQNTRCRRARAPADWRPARGHGGDSMPRRGADTSARHAVVRAFARPADSGPGDGSRTGPVVSRRRSGAGQPFSRAASSIRRVTAPGWLTMTACEEWISSACALARFAKQRSFSGSMIWSFAAVR